MPKPSARKPYGPKFHLPHPDIAMRGRHARRSAARIRCGSERRGRKDYSDTFSAAFVKHEAEVKVKSRALCFAPLFCTFLTADRWCIQCHNNNMTLNACTNDQMSKMCKTEVIHHDIIQKLKALNIQGCPMNFIPEIEVFYMPLNRSLPIFNRQNLAGQNPTVSCSDAADAAERFGWPLILCSKRPANPRQTLFMVTLLVC